MGQIADDIIDGVCCALCGQYFVDEKENLFVHGHPFACNECWTKDCGYEKQSKDAQVI